MTDQLPTVDIKGKDYVLVKDRVVYFNDKYPNGSITTQIHSYENGQVIIKAMVVPDTKNPDRIFIDYSQAKESEGMINKTSALENASTSAVGRALAMMGIGVIESIASADEVAKTTHQPTTGAILANAAARREPMPSADDHLCQVHKIQMKERVSPAGGTYYDHRHKNIDGIWETCMGSGYKADMKRPAPRPEGLTEEDERFAHGDPIESKEPTADEIAEDVPF